MDKEIERCIPLGIPDSLVSLIKYILTFNYHIKLLTKVRFLQNFKNETDKYLYLFEIKSEKFITTSFTIVVNAI